MHTFKIIIFNCYGLFICLLHVDIGSTVYNRCPHGPFDDNAEHGWLASGSVQHKALLDIVCNKTFLADMGHRTEFCHTGSLENFHSEMLK